MGYLFSDLRDCSAHVKRSALEDNNFMRADNTGFSRSEDEACASDVASCTKAFCKASSFLELELVSSVFNSPVFNSLVFNSFV